MRPSTEATCVFLRQSGKLFFRHCFSHFWSAVDNVGKSPSVNSALTSSGEGILPNRRFGWTLDSTHCFRAESTPRHLPLPRLYQLGIVTNRRDLHCCSIDNNSSAAGSLSFHRNWQWNWRAWSMKMSALLRCDFCSLVSRNTMIHITTNTMPNK